MKKILAFLLCLFGGVVVVNADTLTITYDANDGSGRTKVVELEKGDSYEIAGNDIFEQINNDPDDPMDDRVIDRWRTNPDNTGISFAIYQDITRIDYSNNISRDWEFLNSQTEVTLYAQWTERSSIELFKTDFDVFGDAVSGSSSDSNNLTIEPYKDFSIYMRFEEGKKGQFTPLSYYVLPDFLFSSLPNYVISELEKPKPVVIVINGFDDMKYYYTGYYYIKNGIFFLDLLHDGSVESKSLYAVNDVWVRFEYNFTVEEIENNNHIIQAVTINYYYSQQTATVYPEGEITTKYIDIDTNEEISNQEYDKQTIGNIYSPIEKEIDEYELVETPEDKIYYFEEEPQILYFKYRKKKVEEAPKEEPTIESEKPTEEPKKEEPKIDEIKEPVEDKKEVQENPDTSNRLPIIVFLVSIILLIVLKIIKRKERICMFN